jgi:hypothetical protein
LYGKVTGHERKVTTFVQVWSLWSLELFGKVTGVVQRCKRMAW